VPAEGGPHEGSYIGRWQVRTTQTLLAVAGLRHGVRVLLLILAVHRECCRANCRDEPLS
jgi:hypothetical protein